LLLGLLIVPPSWEWKKQRSSPAADYADLLGSFTALSWGVPLQVGMIRRSALNPKTAGRKPSQAHTNHPKKTSPPTVKAFSGGSN
jgi:hypothetical protein